MHRSTWLFVIPLILLLAAPRAQSSAADDSMRKAEAQDTQRVVLRVIGMYCASCESTVAAMLRRTPGVLQVAVSAKRAQAEVVYDRRKTTPAKLIEVIKRLGYAATIDNPPK